MTEVGVDIVRSRVIKLRLRGVHQDGHQASEAPEGEVENKGKLEAHQQGQRARGVQRAAPARHNKAKIEQNLTRGKQDRGMGGQPGKEGGGRGGK